MPKNQEVRIRRRRRLRLRDRHLRLLRPAAGRLLGEEGGSGGRLDSRRRKVDTDSVTGLRESREEITEPLAYSKFRLYNLFPLSGLGRRSTG